LHHAAGEPASIADQAMIMAGKNSEHPGKSEDDLEVREAQQQQPSKNRTFT
jgi:hypothetical protein